jgi:hypothetical protein
LSVIITRRWFSLKLTGPKLSNKRINTKEI